MELVQDSLVGDCGVGAHRVDPRSGHQVGVPVDVGAEVGVPAALCNRIPANALQVQGLSIDEDLPAPDLDLSTAGRLRSRLVRAGRLRTLQAAGAEHIRSAFDRRAAGAPLQRDARLVHLLRGGHAHVAEALAVAVAPATVGPGQHQGLATSARDAVVNAGPRAEGLAALALAAVLPRFLRKLAVRQGLCTAPAHDLRPLNVGGPHCASSVPRRACEVAGRPLHFSCAGPRHQEGGQGVGPLGRRRATGSARHAACRGAASRGTARAYLRS
mmetsp:Transcript_72603/g.212794  ORF Transcript_72603/g.212794 Transcript_72603/m.212794 type:complete len:271 (-) Transcript_72603:36-848(-)